MGQGQGRPEPLFIGGGDKLRKFYRYFMQQGISGGGDKRQPPKDHWR